VVLLVLAAVGGTAAGRLRRPAGGHGARPHIAGWPLLAGALALFLLSAITHDDISVVTVALALAVLAGFAGTNWQVTGLAVLGIGVVLNLAGVVLNNGTPVRPQALVQAHAATAEDVGSHHLRDPRHLESGDDSYGWLGAIVPVPIVHEVLSFGDLLVLVGLTDAARDLGRRRSRLPEVDEDEDEDEDEVAAPDPGEDGERAATGWLGRPEPHPRRQERSDARSGQTGQTTQAKVDQDWGAAPSGEAESGSQCSAKPETTTADVMEFWKDAALAPSPAHLAARQTK
jgi:hypothetical protein